MDNKIGAYDVLQYLAATLLKLEGGAQMPTVMSSQPVQAVLDIGQYLRGDPPGIVDYSLETREIIQALDGVGSYSTNIFAPDADHDYRLLAFDFQISCGAGAAAAYPVLHSADITHDEVIYNVWDFKPWNFLRTGANAWDFRFALGGHMSSTIDATGASTQALPSGITWNGFIPSGTIFGFDIALGDSGLFPVDCDIHIKALAASVTKGRLPL